MNTYNMDVVPVKKREKQVLGNLLEKYNYEFSQYDDRDVDNTGLYGYKYLDHYWREASRHPFFIRVDGNLAGFVMISEFPETDEPVDHSVSEFFVMHKYRRSGVGRFAAYKVFDLFPGRWQLKRHPKNVISVRFWDRVVGDYTKGNFRMVTTGREGVYEDGTPGEVLLFNSENSSHADREVS